MSLKQISRAAALGIYVLPWLPTLANSQELVDLYHPERPQPPRTGIERELQMPQEVPIPDDVVTYEEVRGYARFPRLQYMLAYFDAWNEYLFVVGNTDVDVHGNVRSECLTPVRNSYVYRGHADGFDKCQENVISLLGKYDLKKIREAARRVHLKMHDGVAWGRNQAKNQDSEDRSDSESKGSP